MKWDKSSDFYQNHFSNDKTQVVILSKLDFETMWFYQTSIKTRFEARRDKASNPSWTFEKRSILEGRKVLVEGIRWRIGDGKNARVLTYPWHPNQNALGRSRIHSNQFKERVWGLVGWGSESVNEHQRAVNTWTCPVPGIVKINVDTAWWSQGVQFGGLAGKGMVIRHCLGRSRSTHLGKVSMVLCRGERVNRKNRTRPDRPVWYPF